MLRLNEKLDLEQPPVLKKPFSLLQVMLNEINDIDDKDHFKDVKERLEISKKNVSKAIRQFEEGEIESIDEDTIKIDMLKNEMIGMLISENYNEEKISSIEMQISSIKIKSTEIDYASAYSILSGLYLNWGNDLGKLAETKEGKEAEDLYKQAFEKYNKAIDFGGTHYNLACLFAITEDEKNALHFLDISLGNNEIS